MLLLSGSRSVNLAQQPAVAVINYATRIRDVRKITQGASNVLAL